MLRPKIQDKARFRNPEKYLEKMLTLLRKAHGVGKLEWAILPALGLLFGLPVGLFPKRGCPSLRALRGGVAADLEAGLADSTSPLIVSPRPSSDKTIISRLGSGMLIPFETPVKGRTWREHTSRASTATDRRIAQKTCVPKSRDPERSFAWLMKSTFERIISSPSCNAV